MWEEIHKLTSIAQVVMIWTRIWTTISLTLKSSALATASYYYFLGGKVIFVGLVCSDPLSHHLTFIDPMTQLHPKPSCEHSNAAET